VEHSRGEDGTLSVARLWRRWRGDHPGGGLVSSVADQLRWARFHLGDGRADSGERVLPTEVLHQMQEPTVALRGSNLGEAIGIAWFLREVDGVGTVGHGGSATASSPSCSPCPNATSPWSRCPTPSRTAPPATRPWSAGRCKPTFR
jgi:CubicO group peptidase (beta-lactamase class C family)